jgi:hypothetical protein
MNDELAGTLQILGARSSVGDRHEAPHSGQWSNIMVHTEEILGIILSLELP